MIESLKMVLNPRLSSEIDIKKATKSFGQKFACGTSVTGDDEIIIQGDVKDDVIDFIQEKWPEVWYNFPPVFLFCMPSFSFQWIAVNFCSQVDDSSIHDLGTKKW